MQDLKAGTTVYLKQKGLYYQRFLVGFNSEGVPVLESVMPNGVTKYYMAVPSRRIYTDEQVYGLTESPK